MKPTGERKVHAQYKAEDGKLHEEERDVTKYWKKDCASSIVRVILWYRETLE